MNTVGGEILWGINGPGCWSQSEPNAVWATARGQNGETDCSQPYPNVTDSRLVYGPFSLANATSAFLSVHYFVNTEQDFDTLQVKVSLDGGSTFPALSNPLSGSLGAGVLSGQLPAEMLGQQSIYLAFDFHSDTSIGVAGGGAFIDDVLLTAEVAGGGGPDTPTPTHTPTRTPTTTGRPHKQIFLPFGSRAAAVATVTPPAADCQELIKNGGFEQAAGKSPASWALTGNISYATGVDGHATPNIVYFGYGSGQDKGRTGDLVQGVAVPANPTSATLSFWYNLLAGASTPIKLQIDVLDQGGANVLLPLGTITQGKSEWQQASLNLSAAQLAPVAGRGVVLRFRVTDIDGPLDLFFDDVSWRVCG
jgi:hypothetical protein